MDSTKVFISYCHDEVQREKERIQFLIQELERHLADKKFELIVDYKYLRVGSNISTFMADQAKNCDVAIVLMTPEYKRRVQERKQGVYKEFNVLYQRYLKHQSEGTHEREFLLMPILFLGKAERSVPEEIEHLLRADLTKLYVSQAKNGTLYLEKPLKALLEPVFRSLSEATRLVRYSKSKEYQKKRDHVFKFLFKDAKSQWNQNDSHQYIDGVFVKTHSYLRVRDEHVRFVIGRKGSGKSTITHILPVLEKGQFDFSIPVVAESIFLEACYNLFSTNAGFESDSKQIFTRLESLKFVWDVFLHLCFAYQFVIEFKQYWEDPQIKPLKDFIFDLLRWDDTWSGQSTPNPKDFNALFLHSFSRLPDFSKDCFMNMRDQKYAADLATQFHIDRFREFSLGKNTMVGIWNALSLCNKRILISFDGFDTAFEFFRRDSLKLENDDLADRVDFEQKWLLSFILLLHDNGLDQSNRNGLYKKFHYCVTVPFDRYLEMKELDRDAYRNRNDFMPLMWTGPELSALIRKRLLEFITEFDEDKLRPEDKSMPLDFRLDEVMRNYYPEIPNQVEVKNGQVLQAIPLFTYLLRHSFWRPRDLLYYYGDIIAASKSPALIRRGKKLDGYTIKQVVRQTARSVINDEFFGEFSSLFINIKDSIEEFYGAKQILSWQELSEICAELDFQMASGNITPLETNDKIEFLYSVGFLGVVIPEDVQKKHENVHKYAFIFNEDTVMEEVIGRKRYHTLEFVIHPIFCEFLHLDLSGNREFVLNFDWEYLYRNELFRSLKPTVS